MDWMRRMTDYLLPLVMTERRRQVACHLGSAETESIAQGAAAPRVGRSVAVAEERFLAASCRQLGSYLWRRSCATRRAACTINVYDERTPVGPAFRSRALANATLPTAIPQVHRGCSCIYRSTHSASNQSPCYHPNLAVPACPGQMIALLPQSALARRQWMISTP